MSDDVTGSATAERGLHGATAAVASFDETDAGLVRRIQGFLHDFPTTIPFIVLLIGVVIFSFAAPGKFLSPLNLSVVLQQVTIIAILGVAQTLVILTAGIDLSVGVIMILCTVVMGRTAVVYGVPVYIAFPLGLLAGTACGFVNGLIVTRLKLPPFIVTLGTWNIVMATNFIYSANETIRDADVDAQAPLLHFFALSFRVGSAVLTAGVIAMVLLVLVLWYVLNHTAWGRHVYAVGDDPEAAKLSGILLEAGPGTSENAWLAIGIGVNLAEHPADTEFPATSLAALGVTPPAADAALTLLAGRFAHWQALWQAQGFEPLRAAWLARAGGLGTPIRARLPHEERRGAFEGIDATGALLLREASGVRTITAGEVFF